MPWSGPELENILVNLHVTARWRRVFFIILVVLVIVLVFLICTRTRGKAVLLC